MRVAQISFAAGEISEQLYAREDLAKYAVGCKQLRNCVVHPHGGVSNRAGTTYVGQVRSAGSRLIPFRFSATDNYVLEFGDKTMRVIRNGGYVGQEMPTTYWPERPYLSYSSPNGATRARHVHSVWEEEGIQYTETLTSFEFGYWRGAPTPGYPLVQEVSFSPSDLYPHIDGMVFTVFQAPLTSNLYLLDEIGNVIDASSWPVHKITQSGPSTSYDLIPPRSTEAAQDGQLTARYHVPDGSSYVSDIVGDGNKLWLEFPMGADNLSIGDRITFKDFPHPDLPEGEYLVASDAIPYPDPFDGPVGVKTRRRIQTILGEDIPSTTTWTRPRPEDALPVGVIGGAFITDGYVQWMGHGLKEGDLLFGASIPGDPPMVGVFFYASFVTENTFWATDVRKNVIPISAPRGSPYKILVVYEIETPYSAADLADLSFTQSADEMTLVHPKHPPQLLRRTDHDAWTITPISFAPKINPPVMGTPTRGPSGGDTYIYRVTAEDAETAVESMPSATATITAAGTPSTANPHIVRWSASAGASRYHVYKESNGVFGFIGTTTGLLFEDNNIIAEVDDTPPDDRQPFVGEGNYPALAGYYQQRQIFARTLNAPNKMWTTKSADFRNLQTSTPAKADDAITITLVSQKVNEIKAIVPASNLMLLTSDGEWAVRPANGEALAADDPPAAVPQSFWGSSGLQPILAGDAVLFVDASQRAVREMVPNVIDEAKWGGKDMTVLAQHLLRENRIVSWDYQRHPDSIIWAARDDGCLLAFSYQREHEVFAWSLCETVGRVKDVCVLREGLEDVVYLLVERELAGAPAWTVERMASRLVTSAAEGVFLDASIQTTFATPSATIPGLWHLEGMTVTVIADGNVMPPAVVTNGAVTLSVPVTEALVGLPYTSRIETLPVRGVAGQRQTGMGAPKAIGDLVMRVFRTRGIWAGPSFDEGDLIEVKQRTFEEMGAPIELFTGDIQLHVLSSWEAFDGICIEQRDPLPMTILAIAPEVDMGE